MKNKYFRLLPICIGGILIIFYFLYSHGQNKEFVEKPIKSLIIERNNWQIRTSEFYLQNGLRIDSSYIYPLDLKVGDSISKEANSYKFKVYRKKDGQFRYIGQYDIRF